MDYYAQKVSPQSKLEEHLDSIEHLAKIAMNLKNVGALVAKLELQYSIYYEIKAQYPDDMQQQRCELLREWKHKNGFSATYKALLSALVDLNEHAAAETVVNCLKDLPDTAGSTSYSVKSNPPDTAGSTSDSVNFMYLGKVHPSIADLDFIETRRGKTYSLLHRIASHYKSIAFRLGIASYKVEFIDRIAFEDRVVKVFQEWLQNAEQLPRAHNYPLSWQGLRSILEDSNLNNVACEYFDVLKDTY